jgi:AraC-like DNA-binding protein
MDVGRRCVGAARALKASALALMMSAQEPSSMVIGSEALRLRLFLLAHELPLPRVLHTIARNAADAVDERVSARLLVDGLAAAMRKLRRPSLPVDFGASIQPADMGIYGMAILAAPTVGDALERSVRFQRLMTNTAHIELEQTKRHVCWLWRCSEARSLGVRLRNEVVLAEHVAIVRALAPGSVPRGVSFAHHAPEDCTAHQRFFNCPVAWAAEQNSVEWACEGLNRPLGVDTSLGAFIDREAQRRLRLLPAGGTLAEVRDTVLRQLPQGDVNLPTIAALLGRAPRSLRRELASGGCTYRKLVDNLRQQRAVELCGAGGHSMTDIAMKLGFSELSAFGRAWRRWFGQAYPATKP